MPYPLMRRPAHCSADAPSGALSCPYKEHQMVRSMVAVAAVAIGITSVMAQSDPLSQRKTLMKGNGQHIAAVNKMAKGEEPYDQAKVDAAFAQWTETAQKLPSLFPEPPKPGEDTRALPKIWENKSDFEAKTAAFTKVIADNRDKAKSVDEVKAIVPLIGKTCGDCHEPYRKPAPR
jgi:cytochrome c556